MYALSRSRFQFVPRRLAALGCIAAAATFLAAQSAPALDLPDPLSTDDFVKFDPAQAKIGRLLFYDKILSGNQNISCGTCHHHDLGSGDGLSLGTGEGGVGIGADRTAGAGYDRIKHRIPRNAPALWNLGHTDVESVFHDGRLSFGDAYGNGFETPAKEHFPSGIESIIAAQSLFPMTSGAEMAGQPGENDIADAVAERMDLAWPIVAARVRAIPEYAEMFVAAFDHVNTPDDVTIVEIGNSLGAFIGTEWQNFDSPFDKYLAGDETALNDAQMRGMELFYEDVGCASCHAGPLMSDQGFHSVGLPQFGPGRPPEGDTIPRDLGRMEQTGDPADAYRFNTPFLRNIALTAPYGHNGAMPTLEDMVRHHCDPLKSLAEWTPEKAVLSEANWLKPVDFLLQSDTLELKLQRANIDIDLPAVSEDQVADIVAFLHALTGETALARPMGRPDTVPSGLPVD